MPGESFTTSEIRLQEVSGSSIQLYQMTLRLTEAEVQRYWQNPSAFFKTALESQQQTVREVIVGFGPAGPPVVQPGVTLEIQCAHIKGPPQYKCAWLCWETRPPTA